MPAGKQARGHCPTEELVVGEGLPSFAMQEVRRGVKDIGGMHGVMVEALVVATLERAEVSGSEDCQRLEQPKKFV